MATRAAMNGGADERSIARITQHRSLRVLRRYIHAGTMFDVQRFLPADDFPCAFEPPALRSNMPFDFQNLNP